ncbi:MAG: serine hydrolase domain-containing protein [Bacteroidales bacterium]
MLVLRVLLFIWLLLLSPARARTGEYTVTHPGAGGVKKENPPLPDSQLLEIKQIVDEILIKNKFNGSVLIGYKDYVLYENAIGLASLRQRNLLTEETPFQLASVSKSFTALSVLLLVQEGRIRLDEPLKNYLPEFPYPSVTVRHLLNHTSGVPNYVGIAASKWRDGAPRTNEDMLELLVKNKLPLRFKPGTRFQYSNTGYALLALLVEKVSGQPFQAFLKTRIFEPLEMENTFAYDRSVFETREVAIGHRGKNPAAEVPWPDPLDDVLGDKSIYSTPADLFKYSKAWTSDILLGDSLRNLAFTPGKLNNNRETFYGFGWRLKTLDGRPIIYHNGLWHGFTATFTRIPDAGLTIIMLNNTNAHVGRLAWQIVRRIEPLLNTGKSFLPEEMESAEDTDETGE